MNARLKGAAASGFRGEHGIALMMVLWVLVLLSIISMNFLASTRWGSASVRNFKEDTQAYYLALSGFQEAVNYLTADKDLSVDFLDGEGTFWIDSETPPITGKHTTEDGEYEIRISDENGRININFATEDRLAKLFSYCGVKQEDLNVVIDSIMDWKDPDSEHHLSGAEDDYYEALPEPYKAKNSIFDVPEELALVKGMKPEYLYGTGEGSIAVMPFITTFGKNMININTASKEIMEILGLNVVEIETIFKQRNKDYGGFRFIPQQFSARGLNAVATQNFRIEVFAKMHHSPIASRVTGILYRRPSAEGVKIQTIYWSERAEAVRG
ncbi:MAG: general secretion pathway protein GspK [Nitrospirae bacterium]|nr:general secretion pathway protein GspK [Nitrospirota bacterium]